MSRMKKWKQRKKGKKGSSVLEFAFGLMTFVLLAAFVVDVLMVSNKRFTVSQTANQLVRQMAVQGGVRTSAPQGYPGGDRAYMDAGEMVVFLEDKFESAGIEPDEWTMRITGFDPNGYTLESKTLTNRTNLEVDYRNNFEFEINYRYKWDIIGQIIPTMRSERDAVQKRNAVSEYKYHGL